jgi:hypothetical protein
MSRSDIEAIFGGPLVSDPQVALSCAAVSLPKWRTGPLPRVQFMVELVGPRSVAASAALAVLDNPWRQGLGEPDVFVMAPADQAWRAPLRADPAASFDSVVLAWDYLGPRGALSQASTTRLVQSAESFAQTIQRRAMPMPTPDQVDALVADLQHFRETFDIGIEIGLIPTGGAAAERAVWRSCTRLGLDLAANGSFVWHIPGWPMPVLSVDSWDDGKSFSLSNARSDVRHEALGVGFNVPTSPDPAAALMACFKVADALASDLGAVVIDEEGVPFDTSNRRRFFDALPQALDILKRKGLEAGSAEAAKLFNRSN